MKAQEATHSERLVRAETQLEFVIDRLDEVNENLHKLTAVVQDSTQQMTNIVNNTLHQTQEFYRLAKADLEDHKKANIEEIKDINKRLDNLEQKADKVSGALWILSIICSGAGLVIGYLLKR